MPQSRFLSRLPVDAAHLLRVVHELSFARDIPTVTEVTRIAARQLTAADGVTFVLCQAGQCYYADEDAIAPLWKGRRFPRESCISGWVMAHRTPAIIPDIYADSRVPHDAYRSTFVKSLVMVPVGTPDPIAAIGAYWAEPHQPTDDEVGALILLADSAALALANVQLYDELRSSADREQRARIAAETATRAKDEFLALVAHELRQPLHACLAALRLMSARVDRDSGERARAVVERQIVQMNRLVEDLVDAARVVRGQVELRVETTELRPLVEQVVESVRPLMRERGHDLVLSLPDRPLALSVDAARLQQVLMNLLTNAAKYTNPGGRVGLSIANGEANITIKVHDTGRGIDADVLPHIFELFTRGVRDKGGFGVGLAVARRLTELHGGTIEARSGGAGQGSEFIVSLPLNAVV